MTTVSRSQLTAQEGVTGAGEWDSRLNRLLEDLQETVIPTDSRSRNAAEYREYRLTQRTRVNDEPPQSVDEKWVEIGNLVGGGPVISGSVTDSAYGGSSRFTESKSVAFADETSSSSRSNRPSHMEYLAPANTTTELRSGPSSPTGYSVVPSGSSRSPKVERKEFYSKASYTTMIKGTGGDVGDSSPYFSSSSDNRLLDNLIPTDFPSSSRRVDPGLQTVSSSSETRKTYMTETQRTGMLGNGAPSTGIGAPLYSSTPMKPLSSSSTTTSYTREVIPDRSVTPPPKHVDPLKTPPMIRKILQSSQKDLSSSHHHHTSSSTHTTSSTSHLTSSSSKPPPVGGVPLPIIHAGSSPSQSVLKPTPIPSYDDPPERLGARYYTSTVTTEHRERDVSPIRRFPSPQPPKQGGEPPKRLDDLLASFEDTSYSRTTTYGSDGPHKSVPYGPGSHSVQPVHRSVRIDDTVTTHGIRDDDSELVHRKNVTQYQNPAYGNKKAEPLEPTRNISGPPVFYPPGQMFTRTEEESAKTEVDGGKGKGKMKMERSYKEKEKMKSKHSEKDGGGAVPVPVCLPVCCAAPCSIM